MPTEAAVAAVVRADPVAETMVEKAAAPAPPEAGGEGLIVYTPADMAEIGGVAKAKGGVMAGWAALKPEFDEVYAGARGELTGRMADDVLPLFRLLHERSAAFRAWHAANYRSQDDMWAFAARVVASHIDACRAAYAALPAPPQRRGSLSLDAAMVPPRYVTQDGGFHRQPGGYCVESDEADLRAGALYDTANECYFRGIAMILHNPRIANLANSAFELMAHVEREYPEQWARWSEPGAAPRIVDVGCGTGHATLAWKARFPNAEVVGVDVGGGLLRWAHLLAERRGVAVRYEQADAERLAGHADGSCDLVVSHILFHELPPDARVRVLAACRRVLRPGGAMLHLDVSNQDWQPPQLGDPHAQFRQHWQTHFQGEPFWSSHASSRLDERARAGGVELTVHKQVPMMGGKGCWLIFGAAAGANENENI